jgi:hypothetical protein
MSPTIQQPKLILCEGKDEENFFTALLAHLGRSDVQVLQVQGKHGFSPRITLLVQDPNFRTVTDVLVVRDADCVADGAGFSQTWRSVTQVLRQNNLPVPTAHAQFVPGPPRVAVFVMPDGASDGMLETLCWRAVQGDPAVPCVVAYFDCLKNAGLAHIPHLPRNTDKAFMHAFLASRPEPDKRLGEAAQASYLDWTATAFVPLIDLLKQL